MNRFLNSYQDHYLKKQDLVFVILSYLLKTKCNKNLHLIIEDLNQI